MSVENLDHLFITGVTPKGRRLLANEALQRSLQTFIDADEPEKARVPGARFLAAGDYAFVFAVEGLVLKVVSPTSSQRSHNEHRPISPENLEEQFAVLTAFNEHLAGTNEGVITPDQYFVAHTPRDAYLLGQEDMAGWVRLDQRTRDVYGSVTNQAIKKEILAWTGIMRARIQRALGGFALAAKINDVGLEHPDNVHGGNLLVPEGADLDGSTPLCIIDQPGHLERGRKSEP
jgi:hypothetical protein